MGNTEAIEFQKNIKNVVKGSVESEDELANEDTAADGLQLFEVHEDMVMDEEELNNQVNVIQ